MVTKIFYEFVNSHTGNIIGHLSLAPGLDKKDLASKLHNKRAELATVNHLNIESIYWQDREHPIR